MPFRLLAPPGRAGGPVAAGDDTLARGRAATLSRLREEGALDFAPAVLDDAHIGDIEGPSAPSRCMTVLPAAACASACSRSPPSWGPASS